MRRALYLFIHLTITTAAWGLLHLILGVHWVAAAVLCGLLAALDDTAVAKLTRVLVRG